MTLQESLQVVMQQQNGLIGDRFYKVFFDQCPEAAAHFDGVDMGRQAHVVTMALLLVGQLHARRFAATEDYLRYLGTRHQDRSIPQELYPKWRKAMLETLANTLGDQWDAELDEQWQATIDTAIGLMIDGYQTRMTI